MSKKIPLFFLLAVLTFAAGAAGWTKIDGEAKADASFHAVQGEGSFQTAYSVTPGKTYLFTAEIQSPNAVTFSFEPINNSTKRAVYHKIGEKQTVMAFFPVRTDSIRAKMTITEVRDFEGVTKIGKITLKEVVPDSVSPAAVECTPTTRLDENTVIVIPGGKLKQDYLPLGEKIRAKLGNAPELLSDDEVCEKDSTQIRKEYAGKTLVILGNLNTNRAIWHAYGKTLAASDAFYPGGSGYELRTACNVLKPGVNQIIIGGSSLEGVRNGTDEFLKLCKTDLPYLLKVKLDGECAETVNADIARWKNFPKGKFPGTTPGYDTVRRWYHHALMYYWTGSDFYRSMNRKFFETVLKQKAYTHHYMLEWLFLTWEVTRNTDLYTASEKKEMEKLLFRNYLELQNNELIWFRALTPPYTQFKLNSRHVTSPLWCQLMSSDYLFRCQKLPSPYRELVDFTRSEALGTVVSVAENRSRPDADYEGGHDVKELSNSIYRYIFRFDRYDLFKSGKAKDWGNLVFFAPNYGGNVLYGCNLELRFPASILASWYRSPEYQFYALNARGNNYDDMFVDRYPCGIGTFRCDLKPAEAGNNPAAEVIAYAPHEKNNSTRWGNLVWKERELQNREPVIAAILRSGNTLNSSDLAISGTMEQNHTWPGEIADLTINRNSFLNTRWTSIYHYDSGLPFERNLLHVARAGEKNPITARPAIGFLNWKNNSPLHPAVSLLLPQNNGTAWTRTIVVLSETQFLIYDTVTVLQDDLYDISVVWRPSGTILPAGTDTLYTRIGGTQFSVQSSGKGFILKTNTGSYLKKDSDRLLSLYTFHGNLKKGETISCSSLLQGNGKMRVSDCGNGRVLLSEDGKVTAEIILSDKGIQLISRTGISVSAQSKVKIGQTELAVAQKPEAFDWDFESGEKRYVSGVRKAGIGENMKMSSLCGEYLDSLKLPAESATASAGSNAVEKSNEFSKVWSSDPALFRSPTVFTTDWRKPGTVDLGRVAEIAAIRNVNLEQPLPAYAEYSVDGKEYKKLDLSGAKWSPGIWTHNYGNIAIREKGIHQITLKTPVRAQYFRYPAPSRTQYYMTDVRKPYRPVRILNTEPYLLVANEVNKIYPRGYQWDQSVFCVLDDNGKTVFRKEQQLSYHDMKVIDYPEKDSIAVTHADGTIKFYDRTGRELRKLDIIADMQAFHKKYGRSNTRHPAGAYPSVYAVGSWRNPSGLIAGRYGQASFYNSKGALTGIRAGGLYGVDHILNCGVDFNGDGKDELLAMSNCYLIHYSGEPVKTPPAPGTTWPEVYERKQFGLPVWWNLSYGVWGPKVYFFDALSFNGKKAYAAAVSRVCMFVYDAAKQVYAWRFCFDTPVCAADMRELASGKWLAVTAADSGVLTVYEWADPVREPKITASVATPEEINAIAVTPEGRIFFASVNGIFELKGTKLIRHISGSFTDVKWSKDRLLTADRDGVVSCWKGN